MSVWEAASTSTQEIHCWDRTGRETLETLLLGTSSQLVSTRAVARIRLHEAGLQHPLAHA